MKSKKQKTKDTLNDAEWADAVEYACSLCGTSEHEFYNRRTADACDARRMMYGLLHERGYNNCEIAKLTHRSSHVTIIAGLRVHETFLEIDKQYKSKFNKFKEHVNNESVPRM